MFIYARAFNQPVEAWDVGQVTNMQVRRRPVSQDRGLLHTQLPSRSATSRARVLVVAQNMFYYANSFNQPVDAWDVGKVSSMGVRCHLRRD